MSPTLPIPTTARRVLSLAALLASILSLTTTLSILAAPAAPTPADSAAPPAYDASKLQKIQKLDHPTTISGYLCKGYYRLYADGSLNQARLAAPAQIQGLTLPTETTVWFYPGGKKIRRMWLGAHTTIQGVPCNDGNDTVFYPSGRLEATFISAPATIQGLPLKKSGLCPVYFYENGKLKQATLDQPAEIGGKKYPKDLTLHFDETGAVIKTEPIPTWTQRWGHVFAHYFGKGNKK